MKKLIIPIAFFAALAFAGCKKYLDVTPKSSLSEEQLFESEIGFQQALTGVYSQLSQRGLYGDNLSMGFVSGLAQNYAVSAVGAPLVRTRALDYASAEVTGHLGNTWTTAYAAIAGVNKVIENTTEKRAVLSDQAYAQIRGEALALRALLHFDLYRLFGPEYSAGLNSKAIPYKTKADQYSRVPSTSKEVADSALADLQAAALLLKTVDPIFAGATNRNIKMNYYAVKGLEARLRITIGDKSGAAAAAKEVVDAGKFPFVTPTAAAATAASRDRIYKSELLFGARVRTVKDWSEGEYFRFYGNTNMRLTRTTANFATLFETAAGGGSDFRFAYRIEQDGNNPFPSKFWQTYTAISGASDSVRLDQLVPVIRLSEMYYILAESAATPAEGAAFLNMVRKNRGIAELPVATITQTTLNNELTKEYQKEFYGEGQLFFYYKRKKVVRMQFMTADIALSKYVLPIPAAELEYNPTYN
ncbi:RagB/SusD family nutrient uptake outer membrane protein [uncultured Chitinophaga sp.]|uniref:RagB/SusD family nutrient uptake outer membrane protein n=1 Tax=uncultured Chitinophaga sp. TaxID=339340 RepID=UPI0025DB0EAB|nr:RagB/SusD family nutrient uptake outer membrane protein [uncultured Chitinophaga sp.]